MEEMNNYINLGGKVALITGASLGNWRHDGHFAG